MSSEVYYYTFLVLGVLLLLSQIGWRREKRKTRKTTSIQNPEKAVIALEKLGAIWRDKEKIEVALNNLSRIWKSLEDVEKTPIEDVPNFKNDDILEFYIHFLRGRVWFGGKVKEVIIKILEILDKEGDCPSVVNRNNESYEFDQNLYNLLSKITLREHSIRVAKKCFEFGVSGLSEPKVIITALAHDLGKIPKYHKEFYTLGDHPIISVQVLKNIRWFADLSYAEDIEKAVSYHHKTGKGELVELLKKADSSARREEVEVAKKKKEAEEKQAEIIKEIKKEETKVAKEDKLESKERVEQEVESAETVIQKKAEEKAQAEEGQKVAEHGVPQKTEEIVKEKPEDRAEAKKEERKTKKPKGKPKKKSEQEQQEQMIYDYDLSWFSIEDFIKSLRDKINKIESGRWVAFSMPNGLVYVHPTGLWQLLKKQALKNNVLDILTMEGDNNLKRSVLVSLVNILRNKGYIEEELIRDGYFAAPFLVYKKNQEDPSRVLYTPFKVETLSEEGVALVSDFEKLKKGTVIDLIEKVEPDFSPLEEEND